MSKEDLDIDQKCREDFNRWYWNLQEQKDKGKNMPKGIGSSDSSFNELFTRGSFRKYNDNYHNKYIGNSSESVILGEKIFKRSVGTQASVSVVKGKHDDFDDDDAQKEKADAQKDSVVRKSKKFKKVKDDTSDAIEMSKHKMRKKLKKLKKVMEDTSNDE